jgi:hypothetical protein
MPLIAAVVVIILVVLIISWFQDQRLKQRGRRLQAEAKTLGFDSPETDNAGNTKDTAAHPALRNTAHFLLFAQGLSGDAKNIMQGEFTRDGIPVAITLFEYSFSVPMGRYVRQWRQTVFRLASDDLNLPGFGIMPASVFERMVHHIQNREVREMLQETAGVSFRGHPNFNQMMHLQGPNRAQVRELFDESLLRFFEGGNGDLPHYHLCVEGAGDTLLVYRYDHEVAPEDLEAFLDTAWTAYDYVAAASRRLHPEVES